MPSLAPKFLTGDSTGWKPLVTNPVPKRPGFGPIVSHDDVSHDKLRVKNDNSPQKIHAGQEPITLCKGNLSEKKKVTQDCSLKRVVLIALGF